MKLSSLKAKVAALLARIPAVAKTEAKHVALTFVAAFTAVAGPLLPELLRTPSFGMAKALLTAAIAAGVKAAIPAARSALSRLIAKLAARRAAKTPA